MNYKFLALLAITSLAACGGGGGTATGNNNVDNTSIVTVYPSLGKFSNGTVKLYAADGSLFTSAPITNGISSLSTTAGCVPAVIEITNGSFYDEGTNAQSTMNSLPLRAAVSCLNTQKEVAVTALTEIAFQKLGQARDATSIESANEYVRAKYGADLTSILNPPVLIGSAADSQTLTTTEASKYALRLAAFSLIAKKYTQNTMSLISEAGLAVAASGYIDGGNSTTYSSINFVTDFNEALISFAKNNAPNLIVYASTNAPISNSTTAIPSILKSVEFKQLMRLFMILPKNYLLFPEYVVANPAAPNPVYNCGNTTNNGFDGTRINFSATSVNYNNCLTLSDGALLLPYGLNEINSRVLINGNATQILNQPTSSSNVILDLTYTDQTTGSFFGLLGTITNTTPNPGAVAPASWVSSLQPCLAYEYRNGTLKIGSGADEMNLSDFNVCGNDSRLDLSNTLPPTRTLTFIASGKGVSGRTFSNVNSPLVFQQNTGLGGVVGQTVNRTPVFVSGSFTLPTSATDSITLTANPNGTATIIKTTTDTSTSVEVPIATLLNRAIY